MLGLSGVQSFPLISFEVELAGIVDERIDDALIKSRMLPD
jgi:hypothetical protein